MQTENRGLNLHLKHATKSKKNVLKQQAKNSKDRNSWKHLRYIGT